MKEMTQFSIFLVNKPGVLAAVTSELTRARVNLLALTLMDSMEHGVLRIVCDKPEKAREVLGRTHDRWTETDVLVVELRNQPGAFAAVAEKLAEEHINISYAYATSGARGGRTTAVFKVADMKKAKKIARAFEEKPESEGRKAERTVRKAPGGKGRVAR
ncbi:MAG TPA: ACT domain-containing protein [Phycisphaerae bacterium]|nr:ACT domain-containing protein [Phycisphaerae bacterium]